MRVTIDATALLLRSAGVKSYVWHWLHALRDCNSGHQFEGFPFVGGLRELHHDRSIYTPLETYPRIAALHAANYLPGALDLMTARTGVFHTSNQVRRKPKHCRLTATIHDLTAWKLAEFHTSGNRRADEEWAQRILHRADALIAVSENTKRDAVELLGIPPDKITRIYSGVGPAYFSVTSKDVERIRATFALNKPYVLSVGTIEPRKNLDRLLEAWASSPLDLREHFDLVIAGPYGWGAEATLARIRSAERVRYLGYVPEDALPALTAGATLLAYPSLYEGFGFPVVQAMAAGVPVLTSNTSCMPEVAGDGAEYIDPLSVAEIRAALARLIQSSSERARLAKAGQMRAAAYTWENCARQSIQFFEAASGL